MSALRLVWELDDEPLELPPIASSTIRGAIGVALRRQSCVTGAPHCDGCGLRASCPYGYVWETRHADANGQQTVRPPYAFDAPMGPEGHVFAAGESFSATLRLFGMARRYLPQFIAAALEAGEVGFGPPEARRRAILLSAEVHHFDGAVSPVFVLGGGVAPVLDVPSLELTLDDRADERVGHIRVETISPLSLYEKHRGKRRFVAQPYPELIVRKLARRLEELSRVHEAFEPSWRVDHESVARARVIDASFAPVDETRYSRRVRDHVPLEGVVGHMTIENLPRWAVDLIAMSDYLGVGKNANLGFGRMSVLVRDD